MIKSKYVVFTDNGIIFDYTLKSLNKKNKTSFCDDDFRFIGSDKVLYLSKEDITYQRDLHYLSQIPISNLYKVDKRPFYFTLLNIILTLIVLLQITGTRSLIMELISALEKVL